MGILLTSAPLATNHFVVLSQGRSPPPADPPLSIQHPTSDHDWERSSRHACELRDALFFSGNGDFGPFISSLPQDLHRPIREAF
ncbi:hypothetical protein BT69DRAFT_1282068 [Atractiella rhizophila]|nr:hypothetical protein BT69DRAFT_1282068 [Atractiella rhizophila]